MLRRIEWIRDSVYKKNCVQVNTSKTKHLICTQRKVTLSEDLAVENHFFKEPMFPSI
jgi:hypothetical protein